MQSLTEGSQPRDRRQWTEEEDEMLRAAIEEEDPESSPPSRWHAIAQHVPNRTNKDCRKRWWAQMATTVSKGTWTMDEDERLCNAVEELGQKWALVAGRVRTRNSGQCAKRWNDALNPSIDRSGWNQDEDDTLLKAVEEQGHSWANIARTCLSGRTGLAAKNRYNHLIRCSDRPASTRCRRGSLIQSMARRRARGASTSSTVSSSPSHTHPPTAISSPESSVSPSTPVSLGDDAEAFLDVGSCKPSTSRILTPVEPTNHHPTPDSFHPSPSSSLSSAQDTIFDIFMTNTFGDTDASSSPPTLLGSAPLSLSNFDDGSQLFGDFDPFNMWPTSDPGSSQMLLDPSPSPARHDGGFRQSLSPSAALDALPDAIPGPADFLASCSPAHSSPYTTPAATDFSDFFSDTQVTIGGVPAMPGRAQIQLTQPGSNQSDRRVAVAVAICDRQDIGSTVQSLSHSLSTMLGGNRASASR